MTESVESKVSSVKRNPMLNTLILENVFNQCKTCSRTDWANFRQVCRAWNEETLLMWRSSACITFFYGKKGLSEDQLKTGGISISAFVELYEKDELKFKSVPFKNYKFKFWNLDQPCLSPSFYSPSFRYFWDSIGPLIETLHFEKCSSVTIGAPGFQRILFNKLAQMNLKELKLSSNTFRFPSNEEEQREWSQMQAKLLATNGVNFKINETVQKLNLSGMIPFELRIFYQLFPNVEDLCFDYSGVGERTSLILYQNGWWLLPDNTKHFDMMSVPCRDVFSGSLQVLKYMSTMRQNFKTLGFQIHSNVEFLKGFKCLFEGECETLRVLKVFKKPFIPLEDFTFQKTFPYLEELELWGVIDTGFQFLLNMPHLKRLYINQTCFELWDLLKEDIAKGERIKSSSLSKDLVSLSGLCNMDLNAIRMEFLQYLHVDAEFHPESLKKLSQWLPQLKSLHLVVGNNEQFEVICDEWEKLTELELLYRSCIDDKGICSSLSNLSYLTRFSVFTKCGDGRITDQSVHEGFFKLQLLHTLHICVSREMSKDAEELLKQRIFSVRVIRNYGDNHEEECCTRKKFEEEALSK